MVGCAHAMSLLHAHLLESVVAGRTIAPNVRVRRMADDLAIIQEGDDPNAAATGATTAFLEVRADLVGKGMVLHPHQDPGHRLHPGGPPVHAQQPARRG